MPITRKEIEGLRRKVAQAMVMHNRPALTPILDRLTRELEAVDQQDAAMLQARRIIETC